MIDQYPCPDLSGATGVIRGLTGEFLLRGNAVLRYSHSLLAISLLSGKRLLCEVHHGSDTESVNQGPAGGRACVFGVERRGSYACLIGHSEK